MSRNTALLVIAILLLGLNLGYMLGSAAAQPIPIASQAQAGSMLLQSNGEIITTNEDGNKLFLWKDKKRGGIPPEFNSYSYQHTGN